MPSLTWVGLTLTLNPTDLKSDDREWIGHAWLNICRRAVNLPVEKVEFDHVPAVGRISISSPAVAKPLSECNAGRTYGDQIKPFNFLLSCHVKPLGHPVGADPERFHLIRPYDLDPQKWLKTPWLDQYSGKLYGVTTSGHHGSRDAARAKTYGEVLREYEFHPESKCGDAEGNACGKQTVGLLQRRHVQIARVKYIGKESNSLEDVEAGLIHSAQSVYTEYVDPSRDEWQTLILPALKKASLSALVKATGFSRRMIMTARAGTSRPHRKNREGLAAAVKALSSVASQAALKKQKGSCRRGKKTER